MKNQKKQFEEYVLFLQFISYEKITQDEIDQSKSESPTINPHTWLKENNLDLSSYATNWNAKTKEELQQRFTELNINFNIEDLGVPI